MEHKDTKAQRHKERPHQRFLHCGLSLCLCAFVSLCSSQAQNSRKADTDWPMYNRDLAGTRYSPLTEINTKNVAKLTRAWSFKLGAPGPAGGLRGDAPEAEAGARGARGRGGAPAAPTANPEATP